MSGNKRALDFPSSPSKRQRLFLSSESCSNITSQWKYDVFLSFRGEDTRNNFTDHLYAALIQKGIYTFRDDERLERGKEISSELLEAIEVSRFSIVILSEKYTTSTWCLDELAKIVECMETKKHTIFPVFYKVDPSDVRRQTGEFKTAFDKHEQRFRDNMEKVRKWRSALTQVANLSGWHSQDRPEANLIKYIVDNISRRLNQSFSSVVEDLVGIDSQLEKIYELLEPGLDDIRFIGICGMGGIGKTTIARVVFDNLSHKYEGRCFLANVREVSGKKGVAHLQKILLFKVLNESNFHIHDNHEGINHIRRRLCRKRVFVVLDDVEDQLEQLEKLVGKHNWFGAGSRIVITTRDKHVLISHGISRIYEVDGLKQDDALQLFCMKAFRQEQPSDDHVKLSKQVVDYAKGLPLALKVLGSHLCGRSVDGWKSVLNKLQQVPNKNILTKLRISYDGLDEIEKKIFLDIACFFKGKNKDRVLEILDSCDFYGTIGINILVDKSLVTISWDNKLHMHDLLQEMGWEIVHEQHRTYREKWSRLWLFEDVYDVLTHNKGTHAVEGIMLQKSDQRITHLDEKSFSSMSSLRLLKISNVDFLNDLQYLSNELRFLKWHEYPGHSLPSNFNPHKLFELNLCHSRIKFLWKGMKRFQKLKTIKLSYCCNLIETPDFTKVPNLEKLDLEGCTRLRKAHDSIGFLRLLTVLNLKGCKDLESFPSSVCGLKSLKILNLQGCSKLDKLPQDLGEVECLEELDASGTAVKQVPSSIARLTNLQYLSFRECKEQPLQSWRSSFWSSLLPRRYPNSMCLVLASLAGLYRLKTLDLSECNLFQGAIPNDLGSLCSLEELKLSKNNFISLPESINQLAKLKILCLENCQRLQSLPELPSNLIFVGLEDCTSLENVSGLLRSCTSPDIAVHLFNCSKLSEYPGMKNGLALMLLKQYLQQPVNRTSQCHIRLPEKEIPEWFSCRSDGDSVAIGLPPNWLNDEFMGIAMCGVFSLEDSNEMRYFECTMSIIRNKYFFYFNFPPGLTTIKSDHLWLAYVSRERIEHETSYTMSDHLGPVSLSTSTCIHASFSVKGTQNLNSKVIKCGIRPVYRQEAEYFPKTAAQGSIFDPNHDCSTGNCGRHGYVGMPTKLEFRCNIRRNYTIIHGIPSLATSPAHSDSDEERPLAAQSRKSYGDGTSEGV